jgi:cation transporter-like permease
MKYLIFFLAFYLTFFLAFYLTSVLTYFLAIYCDVCFFMTFFLAFDLASILTFCLAFFLAFWSRRAPQDPELAMSLHSAERRRDRVKERRRKE